LDLCGRGLPVVVGSVLETTALTRFMNVNHAIQWVPASPEYILACFQEEWRQCAMDDDERQLPSFMTTVHEWRQALDLVWWSPLSQALNKDWSTKFSAVRWFRVLVPAREKTLRGVCNLLASRAQRPLVAAVKILGQDCPTAGIFLAIRALLVRAGALPDLRPSTPLQTFLSKWPKVFLKEISRLAPGGLPLFFENKLRDSCMTGSWLLGMVLLILAAVSREPLLTIGGVLFFGFGWLGGLFGPTWFPGRLILEKAETFRDLTEMIVQQQRRYGVDGSAL
jgi:hypothetical protein